MKLCYKLFIVIALLPLIIYSQTHQVYKESFDAEAFETLNLDLNNSYIMIEKSNDDKVHFNYTMEFKNYSKKEIQSFLSKAKTYAEIEKRQLKLKTGSENVVSSIVYSFENPFTLELDKKQSIEDKKRFYRKSKQYFLNLEYSSELKAKRILDNIKQIDKKGRKKKINTKDIKILQSKFTIQVPERLEFLIKAKNSNINFNFDIHSVVKVVAENSSFKFKKIVHPSNTIELKNGKISIHALKGGNYIFDNVREVRIAEMDSVTIQSEFSNLQIGEIGRYVSIEDFNSKIWIYNFDQNFGLFKMDMEYSELNLFYPENSDYSLTTYGHTTKHMHDNISFESPPSRDNTPSKMLVSGNKKNSTNTIDITSEHSIIRLGEDYIDLSK